jgi:glycine hydroxymethyltransferase
VRRFTSKFFGTFTILYFMVLREITGLLDYDKIQEIATKEQPKMIVLGICLFS